MVDFVNNLIIFSANNFHMLSYWLAFFAALLETVFIVGLFLPGSTAILILGALASRGYAHIGFLFLFATVGAILGDNVNYYLGKKYGLQWLQNGFWILSKKKFKKAQFFFNKHGAKSVFLGRFIPSVKEVVPLIAGTLEMDKKKFFLWNILGAIGWGLEWLLAGYIFGQSLDLAKDWIWKMGLVATFLLVIFISGSGLFKILTRRALEKL